MNSVSQIIERAKLQRTAEQQNFEKWVEEMTANADAINAILSTKPVSLAAVPGTMVAALQVTIPRYSRAEEHIDYGRFRGKSEEVFTEMEKLFLDKFGLRYSTWGVHTVIELSPLHR